MTMDTKKRIMVVDDDKEFLEELEYMLCQAGYDVTATSDSSSAIDIANAAKPDLILLDLRMRPVSGFEVAGTLRRSPETSQIPIISISGYYTMQEHEFLMNFCGIRKFLKKPINPQEAIAEIKNILGAV